MHPAFWRYGGFHSQGGYFEMDGLQCKILPKMDDLGGTPISGNLHIFCVMPCPCNYMLNICWIYVISPHFAASIPKHLCFFHRSTPRHGDWRGPGEVPAPGAPGPSPTERWRRGCPRWPAPTWTCLRWSPQTSAAAGSRYLRREPAEELEENWRLSSSLWYYIIILWYLYIYILQG